MSRLRLAVLAWLVVSSANAADTAQLEHVQTEWQNAYGVIIYTILADVKNLSAAPLQYVKVKVVLSDKDGKTVAEREGYNMGAEILSEVDTAGNVEERRGRVQPIPPGGTDHFRLSLDKSDIGKPFRTTQVTIVDVR